MNKDINNIDVYEKKFKEEANSAAIIFKQAKKRSLNREQYLDLLPEQLTEYIDQDTYQVEMDGYHISKTNDNMFTYGIGSCSGLVVQKGQTTLLVHISPKRTTKEIINLLSFYKLDRDAIIHIFPGSSYKPEQSNFNLIELEQILKISNNVIYSPFIDIVGNIFIYNNNIYTMDGSTFNNNYESRVL